MHKYAYIHAQRIYTHIYIEMEMKIASIVYSFIFILYSLAQRIAQALKPHPSISLKIVCLIKC